MKMQINYAIKYKSSIYVAGEGKAIPLQALAGPECSRWLRLPVFKTETVGT
jgi:hypothetical protein